MNGSSKGVPRNRVDSSSGGASADARARLSRSSAPGRRTLVETTLRRAAAPSGARGEMDDVATQAVESRGGGAPLDGAVRDRVEDSMGADLGGVRVHSDDGARSASAALGARAFTYGSDVFLGPGESASDLGLMAHELTHVVQQGVAGPREPRRKVTVGAEHDPAEHQADEVAGAIQRGERLDGWVVPDGISARDGQLTRGEMLALLRAAVTATATEVLGPDWSADECPYLERWFAIHASSDAAAIERMLRRFSGVAVSSAAEYVPAVCARLRGALAAGHRGEDVTPAIQDAGLSASGEEAGGATDPSRVLSAIGEGTRLDGETAARMTNALGRALPDVKVHTDGVAARKASELGASAFAVGRHIGFASGEFQPGTDHGDALMAHELAHVVQQEGARGGAAARGESETHEAAADAAADAAVTRLHGGASDGATPAPSPGSSELSVQRCVPGKKKKKKKQQQLEDVHPTIGTLDRELRDERFDERFEEESASPWGSSSVEERQEERKEEKRKPPERRRDEVAFTTPDEAMRALLDRFPMIRAFVESDDAIRDEVMRTVTRLVNDGETNLTAIGSGVVPHLLIGEQHDKNTARDFVTGSLDDMIECGITVLVIEIPDGHIQFGDTMQLGLDERLQRKIPVEATLEECINICAADPRLHEHLITYLIQMGNTGGAQGGHGRGLAEMVIAAKQKGLEIWCGDRDEGLKNRVNTEGMRLRNERFVQTIARGRVRTATVIGDNHLVSKVDPDHTLPALLQKQRIPAWAIKKI